MWDARTALRALMASFIVLWSCLAAAYAACECPKDMPKTHLAIRVGEQYVWPDNAEGFPRAYIEAEEPDSNSFNDVHVCVVYVNTEKGTTSAPYMNSITGLPKGGIDFVVFQDIPQPSPEGTWTEIHFSLSWTIDGTVVACDRRVLQLK
jgi:hypothetical protein